MNAASRSSSDRLDPCYGAGSQEPPQAPSRDGIPLSGREPGSEIEAGQVRNCDSPGTVGRSVEGAIGAVAELKRYAADDAGTQSYLTKAEASALLSLLVEAESFISHMVYRGSPHGVASISAADTIRRLRLAARLTRDPGRSTLRPRTAVLFDTAADELESVASDNQRLREALVLIAAEASDGWAVSVARTALDEEAT